MNKILTLIISLFLFDSVLGQTINDTIFNNVILIKQENVTTNGNDFLIDIIIKYQKEPIIIFNSDRTIPTKLFFDRKTFLSNQNELILITPDWEFQKEILEREKREGIHIKAERHKFYNIKRSNSDYQIDSLSVSIHDVWKPITLNFKNYEVKENEKKYYYNDCYGSVCCPRDGKWDVYETIQKKVNLFEEKNKVTITNEDVVTLNMGKEGEHCTLYLLSNLSNEQKLHFFQIFKESKSRQIYHPLIQ